MEKLNNYMSLIRLDKPIGFMLSFWPSAWSILLAMIYSTQLNVELIDVVEMVLLFFLGAVIVRSSGCIFNDIMDREFDKCVARTKNRPIAAGLLSVKEAILFAIILLSFGFVILWQFNSLTIAIGVLSVIPIIIYPLFKRFTHWPQVFLGLVFNVGALMGWSAVNGEISFYAVLIYVASFCWTMSYDTIYAFQDLQDDLKIGVKSTATYLMRYGVRKQKLWLLMFQSMFLILISSLYYFMNLSDYFILGMCITSLISLHKVSKFDFSNGGEQFKFNNYVGLCIFLSILPDLLVKIGV